MKKFFKRTLCAVLSLCLLAALCACAQKTPLARTQQFALASEPQSPASDWLALALVRGGAELPQAWRDAYLKSAETYVQERQGILHERKYTEYSRMVLTLTALGEDPRSFAGYDLLLPLGDFEATNLQGINGAIFALLALDCGGYDVPQNPKAAVQATREAYLARILERQLESGGWTLTGDLADADLTAMALQALAPYTAQAAVSDAVERGLVCLSQMQGADGAFTCWDATTSESISQVLIALTSLGVSVTDERFVKNGVTLEDVLLRYALDDGSFCHLEGSAADGMATEQALCALTALYRAESGHSGLYQMTRD